MAQFKNPEERKPIKFVNEGDYVWFLRSPNMVRCQVVAAMGRTARVVNTYRNIDIWASLDELFEKVG